MKTIICTLSFCCFWMSITAVTTQTNIIPTTPTLAPTKTAPAPAPTPAPRAVLPPRPLEQRPQAVGSIYASPGIASLQGGQWVGSDNLYNLPKSLGLVIELTLRPDLQLSLDHLAIEEKINSVLKTAGVMLRGTALFKDTPLPFLHFLIMIEPIEKGYVAYCSGRLFEEVQLARVHLKQGIVWQGITWEKQELIVFPTEQLHDQILRTIENICTAFASRFREQSDKR